MRRFIDRTLRLSFCAALAATCVPLHAQPSPTVPPRDRFGMTPKTFDHHFGSARRLAKAPEPIATDLASVADQVGTVRVFLTPEAGTVIGEIVVTGKVRVSELAISLEEGRVDFNDVGRAPDRQRGDGVFTARFKMDTVSAFAKLRREAEGNAQLLRAAESGKPVFLRRGPRDIVPLKEGLESLRRTAPRDFTAISNTRTSVARLSAFREPVEAARALSIDIAKTPLLTLPRRPFDPRKIELARFFDIPLPPLFPKPAPPVAIAEERSLLVNALGVVEDPGRTFDACTNAGTPGGVWSFGHLVREMAQGTGMTPEVFVQHWLSSWQIGQEANGWIVDEPSRGANVSSLVLDSWTRTSTAFAPGGTLNVDYFPARLLAIVNRPDLADKIGYGSAGSAGEGRLVFGLVNRASALPSNTTCNVLQFTVIFEYGIAGKTCSGVKTWHQRWKDLDANPLGSAAYNDALEAITTDFTDHGSNPAQLPNQSSLNQLRTNEISLSSPWQLREFRLQPAGGSVPAGLLDLVTVKQSPDDSLNGGATLAQFLIDNEADILADRHVVPERFPTILDRFLGARSNVQPSNVFWTADLTGLADPAETRRKFSLNTCNACHGGETDTSFTHINPRGMGSPAGISGFITGIDVTVPVTGGIHHYEDLVEREEKMSDILNKSCFGLLTFTKLPFVH